MVEYQEPDGDVQQGQAHDDKAHDRTAPECQAEPLVQ